MKKILVAAMVAAVFFTSTFSVNAAGLKSVFNAKYYADQYQDLKDAFGYDEEALYQHFITYGAKEGRSMSPVLDVVQYRENYADLNEAFGDDWDAYVEHYFNHGIEEKRDNGTDFDPVRYMESYGDLKEAFGDDYEALVNHYVTVGMEEGRTEGIKPTPTPVPAPAPEPIPTSAPSATEAPEEDPHANYSQKFQLTPDRYIIYDYENYKTVKSTIYYNDGTLYGYTLYKHETGADGGEIIKATVYDAKDNVESSSINEYTKEGKLKLTKTYKANGALYSISDYDTTGEKEKCIRVIYYYEDGSISTYNGFDDNGNLSETISYDNEGNIVGHTKWQYDENSKLIQTTDYDADGKVIRVLEYLENNSIREYSFDETGEITGSCLLEKWESGKLKTQTDYNASGKVLRIWNYNENGYVVKCTSYNIDGTVNYVDEFDSDDTDIRLLKSTTYYENGNVKQVREYDGKGNLLKTTNYNEDGTVASETTN
ncbi:MAG: hypothetical protein IJ379_10120 [Lachnospiraceae bacterium]|nr:hypothetical protein [Lachnospiraceae bacterium]